RLGWGSGPQRRGRRDHERAEGWRIRGERRTRDAPGRPLGRARRGARRGHLREWLGGTGVAFAAEADARLRRPSREHAGATRVGVARSQRRAGPAHRDRRRPRRAISLVMAKSRDKVDELLVRHREGLARAHRVRNAAQLVAMVDALGFCFAFTGEASYPVPAAFDHLSTNDDSRKWEWMWPWKDELAEQKKIYYGKLLVKKPTFVSM